MIPKRIVCKHSDFDEVVFPLLRGRVFHLTKEAIFLDIVAKGLIDSHQRAPLAFIFGSSENSYGRKRGWVSLFDLRDTTHAAVKEALIRYYFLKAFPGESTHAFLFIAENGWSSLVSWREAMQEAGGKEIYLPFVEAWYPGDIPLDLISDSLVVTVESRP